MQKKPPKRKNLNPVKRKLTILIKRKRFKKRAPKLNPSSRPRSTSRKLMKNFPESTGASMKGYS